jgi:hypothetical protein
VLNAAGLNRQRTPHQVQVVCARGDSRPVVETRMAGWRSVAELDRFATKGRKSP